MHQCQCLPHHEHLRYSDAPCRAFPGVSCHPHWWEVSGSLEPRLSLTICPHPTVTGESPPSLSKDLSSTLAGVSDVSFDSDHQFPLDELKIDPLTLDGLHMLNDPDMVLADPATEDTFRMDRL